MLSVPEHGNVPRIGLMERIEGHDPSDDRVEILCPTVYALKLIFFLCLDQSSCPQLNVKLV